MHLKTLKVVEIDVQNFTHCFSFNRSDPSSAVPVKYIAIALNIKLAPSLPRDLLLVWGFWRRGGRSSDEVTNIFESNA